MKNEEPRRNYKLHARVESCVVGYCAVATELNRLVDVYDAGAFEAAVFYSARLLEALAVDAVRKAGLSPAPMLLSNLDALQQFDLVPLPTRAWAHALRRLGNDVRHLLRAVSGADAHLAMLFTERWLEWFFCAFPCGERLAGVTTDITPLFDSVPASFRQFVERCDRPGVDPAALAQELFQDAQILLHTSPAPTAVVAERLIERPNHEIAQRLLDASLQWFPEDARLSQLQGLLWSRCGQLDRAMAILEPLTQRMPHDPEATGILAGVYKRRSLGAADSAHWLGKSHQAYDRGWRSSHNTSAYLGINAATALLMLGRGEESRTLASEVRDLLRGRIERLSPLLPDAKARLSYWDRVTLAESELLVGDVDAARMEYLSAFAAYPADQENIAVSKAQASEIVSKISGRKGSAEFWQVRS